MIYIIQIIVVAEVNLSKVRGQRMEKYTVPQLKDLLRQRGLSCKGLKADLVKRLLEAEGSEAAEGAGAEGGAAGDGRKRKAEVLGRGGKRKSKPTHGFISEGSDDNEEDPVSVGEEAAGEDLGKTNIKEEVVKNDSREKVGVKDSIEKTGEKADEKDFKEKADEKDSKGKAGVKCSAEKADEKDSRGKTDEKWTSKDNIEKESREKVAAEKKQENNDFDKFKAGGWYPNNLDRYIHSDRTTADLAAEGLKNFKAFKVTLEAEATGNAFVKITSLRGSLAESVRFYMAVIEAAKKVDKADQVLTAGRNIIACLNHLINYVGPKEAFDLTIVAAETVTKVCTEVPESLLLQGSGQGGRRGFLEVWTSLAVNLVEQAGQLQTREVVSRLEQVQTFQRGSRN